MQSLLNLQMNRSELKDGSVKVTLEISDSFDNYVTVQVWRDTIMQTQYLCKYIFHILTYI